MLYCGTFEPYQGLEELIKAAPRVVEQVPATVFLLVGDNKDKPYTLTSEAAVAEIRAIAHCPQATFRDDS